MEMVGSGHWTRAVGLCCFPIYGVTVTGLQMQIFKEPKYHIGIIGRGFVGSAVESFLSDADCSVTSYDIADDAHMGGLMRKDIEAGYRRVVEESDIIYVCLPTPQATDGSCYTGIVEEACLLLNREAAANDKIPIVLIKSTMVAGTVDKLQQDSRTGSNLILVCNPEFLTERTAQEDFTHATRHLIGIKDHRHNPLRELLQHYHAHLWPDSVCVFTEPKEAELIKQLTNSYFCVKVIFANHVYQLCQALDIEYSNFIKSALMTDSRLGSMHWKVPGPDDHLGFGGHCFPKDLSGMIKLFENNGVSCDILKIAQEYNRNIR